MKIKFGTFNLYQFVEPPFSWYSKKERFSPEGWLEKRAWLKEQIVKMDCDVIGFQEVFSRDALESLVKELGYDYFETVDEPKLRKKTYISSTVAIASRYPIAKLQRVRVHIPSFQKHGFKGNYAFARVPLKATITLPDKREVLVYVCHLKSNRLNEFEYRFKKEHDLKHKKESVAKALKGTSTTSLHQRLCEASSLFFNIKRVKNIPIVVLGDFNDKEFALIFDALSNPQYHQVKSEDKPLLSDAYYHYSHVDLNPHPEAKELPRKGTSYFLGREDVLDYVFISNHFDVLDYSVMDEHLKEHGVELLLKSDHAQVVCNLKLRK